MPSAEAVPKLLMSRPEFDDFFYVPSPSGVARVSRDLKRAGEEWEAYYQLLTHDLKYSVEFLPAVRGIPNLVFTAHGGWVHKRTFLKSNFRFREQRGEEIYFEKWFKKSGYIAKMLDKPFVFEGGSSFFFLQNEFFSGYHHTADLEAHELLGEIFHKAHFSFKIVDERFYSLENCLTPVNDQTVLAYLPAFDEYSRAAIRETFNDLIDVEEAEALRGACNVFISGTQAVIPENCPGTAKALETRGFFVLTLPFSEFIKAGGGPKSLAMRI